MSTIAGLTGWILAGIASGIALRARRTLDARMEAVARASHELRGPLTAVRLGLSFESRAGRMPPGRLRAIDTELGRAALALDDLAGARDGILRLREAASVDVGGLVGDVVEAGLPRADAVGKRLVHVPGAGAPAPAVLGDRLRLAQALGNLLGNALEHGGGKIEVGWTPPRGGRVRIEVRDDGPGLPGPVAALARRARRGRGAHGRGLAIASTIAAAHGGRLAAAPCDHGARLVLELPVAGDAAAVPAPAAPGDAVAGGSRARSGPRTRSGG